MTEYIISTDGVLHEHGALNVRERIVRCRDCMHYNPKIGCFPRCVVHGANYMMPDDFCSHGKRKEVDA